MKKYNFFRISIICFTGIIILYFLSAANGYHLNEVLLGLSEKSYVQSEGISIGLVSTARWIWILAVPLVIAGDSLERRNQWKCMELHRYGTYKRWRGSVVMQVLGQVLYYIFLLGCVSCINAEGNIEKCVQSIGLLALHIFMLATIVVLFSFLFKDKNLFVFILVILIAEAFLITVGDRCGIKEQWNPAFWSMYIRSGQSCENGFSYRNCVVEMFAGCGMILAILFHRGRS